MWCCVWRNKCGWFWVCVSVLCVRHPLPAGKGTAGCTACGRCHEAGRWAGSGACGGSGASQAHGTLLLPACEGWGCPPGPTPPSPWAHWKPLPQSKWCCWRKATEPAEKHTRKFKVSTISFKKMFWAFLNSFLPEFRSQKSQLWAPWSGCSGGKRAETHTVLQRGRRWSSAPGSSQSWASGSTRSGVDTPMPDLACRGPARPPARGRDRLEKGGDEGRRWENCPWCWMRPAIYPLILHWLSPHYAQWISDKHAFQLQR